MSSPDSAPDPRRARRTIRTQLKAAAWSLLKELPAELPGRPITTHASDGTRRVDLAAARASASAGVELPPARPFDLEQRIWLALVAEKRREPGRAVKAAAIARLIKHPHNTLLRYCLHFMVLRGWLVYRHKEGYDLPFVLPPPRAA